MGPASAEFVRDSIYFFDTDILFPREFQDLFRAEYAGLSMNSKTVFDWNGVTFDNVTRALLYASFPRDYVARDTIMKTRSPKTTMNIMMTYGAVSIDYNAIGDILNHKIRQNPHLLLLLKQSGNKTLVYADFSNDRLGCGFNGCGENILGKRLMTIRYQLTKE